VRNIAVGAEDQDALLMLLSLMGCVSRCFRIDVLWSIGGRKPVIPSFW
jgi:hypothetical protein